MSGKYERKPQKTKRKKLTVLWVLLLIAVLLLAAVAAASFLPEKEEAPDATEPVPTHTVATEAISPETTEAEPQTFPTETTVPEETQAPEYLLSIDENIKITEISSYKGKYMEDGSNDDVEGVMQITVINIGKEPLQYAKVMLEGTAGQAVFDMTTLMPGETMTVLEANRKQYADGDAYSTVQAKNIAYFQYTVSTYEEKLAIQPLDGGFNITNVSGEDITGKITIYFKNYIDGVYSGGITYSGTIEGGMKDGEIKQIMSKNFTADHTRIVFITIA